MNNKLILTSNKSFFFILCLTLVSFMLFGCSGKSKKDIYKGMSADQIYAQGQSNMTKKNYAQAIKDFEALEARYPYGENSLNAQLDLIHAYYKKNDAPLALATANRFIRMNPRHPRVDYAYYLKGLVNYEQNTTLMYRHLPVDRSARDPSPAHASFAAFKDLIELFPNSEFAPEARQRMMQLRNQLANYELYVVDYYMKRGAYLSAANRADYIIKNYDKTEAIPKALTSMIISYRKLGMVQLSDDAEKILISNFPNCPVPK
jgi:outer membrane protein assembly factor BamD